MSEENDGTDATAAKPAKAKGSWYLGIGAGVGVATMLILNSVTDGSVPGGALGGAIGAVVGVLIGAVVEWMVTGKRPRLI